MNWYWKMQYGNESVCSEISVNFCLYYTGLEFSTSIYNNTWVMMAKRVPETLLKGKTWVQGHTNQTKFIPDKCTVVWYHCPSKYIEHSDQ